MTSIINPHRFNYSPADISGLTLWLDANDIDTLYTDSAKTTAVTTDGDAVGCWADKSGNGYDFIQGTAGEKPTYKTGIINSKPIIRADGTEWLENLTKSNWTFLHDGSASTIIIVFELASNPDAVYGLMGNIGSSSTSQIGNALYFDDRSVIPRNDLMYKQVSNGGGVAAILDFPSDDDDFPSGSATIIQADYDYAISGDDATFFNGGTSVKTQESEAETPSTSASTYDLQLFAGGNGWIPTVGDIAEVVIYDEIISATDRAELTAFLKNKWGIT